MNVSQAALLGLTALCGGCAIAHDVGVTEGALATPAPLSASCEREVSDSIDGLPRHLECTGLYKNIANQTLTAGLTQFTPAYPLWSDASVKTRWMFLPEGTKIDASTATAWKFPDGTRFWKEFRNPAGDRRIETRIFLKRGDNDWSRATYEWDASETHATRLDGGKDIDIDGNAYHVPSGEQCDECHAGRRDRVLGFDQVSLGLTGALGMTLDQLVADDTLSNFEGPTEYQIGPDPEADEARALGWMHTNCGVSCHNNNSNSKAYSTGMRLALDPRQLDGGETSEFEAIKTTVDKDVFALQWRGKKRITPGSPDESWLYSLIMSRGNPKEQMPPLASNQVDEANAEIIKRWIESLANSAE